MVRSVCRAWKKLWKMPQNQRYIDWLTVVGWTLLGVWWSISLTSSRILHLTPSKSRINEWTLQVFLIKWSLSVFVSWKQSNNWNPQFKRVFSFWPLMGQCCEIQPCCWCHANHLCHGSHMMLGGWAALTGSLGFKLLTAEASAQSCELTRSKPHHGRENCGLCSLAGDVHQHQRQPRWTTKRILQDHLVRTCLFLLLFKHSLHLTYLLFCF